MANRKKRVPRKDGRISAQVYLGTRPDGSRMVKTVYGKSDKEVDEKLTQLKLKLGKGISINDADELFSVWSLRWLAIQKGFVSHKQHRNLTSYVDHLIRYIGAVPVNNLRKYHLESALNILYACNPNNGKPASKKLLNDVRINAIRIMQDLVDNRILEYNPFVSVNTPANAPFTEREPLTPEEIRWVLNTPHKLRITALLMIYAGPRRGEVIPLLWDDFDLKTGRVVINKAVEFISNRPKLKSPKTEAGFRTIYLPSFLVNELKAARSAATSIYFCPDSKGGLMTETAWRSAWNSYQNELGFKHGTVCSENLKKYIDKVGREKIKRSNPYGVPKLSKRFTAHCLRHTYATILYFSGVDLLTAKEMFGHKDVQLLLDVYTHLDKIHKGKNIQKLDEYCTEFLTGKKAVMIS